MVERTNAPPPEKWIPGGNSLRKNNRDEGEDRVVQRKLSAVRTKKLQTDITDISAEIIKIKFKSNYQLICWEELIFGVKNHRVGITCSRRPTKIATRSADKE